MDYYYLHQNTILKACVPPGIQIVFFKVVVVFFNLLSIFLKGYLKQLYSSV